MSAQPLSSPEEIAASPILTHAEKVQRLRSLSYDVRERQVASEEGMPPGDESSPELLVRVQQALRSLGVDPAESGPTKQR